MIHSRCVLFRQIYVYQKVAEAYLGDDNKAMRFLLTPHPLLDDRVPAKLAAESFSGARKVLKILYAPEAGLHR